MNDFDNALFLLAQRYCKRRNNKSPKNWYLVRKGQKNSKYICHICEKHVCSEIKNGPKTFETHSALQAHGQDHLNEHGLSDFLQ